MGSPDFMVILEQVLRVLAAALIGAIIGYERELKNKPAGYFTFTLVSVGSCLIAILQVNIIRDSIEMIKNNPELADAIKADSGRIIAQVVSGIGFLGAGTIIHNKASVKGITTAALLWLVSALGLMIGTGGINNYIIAAVTAMIIIPISYLSRSLGDKLTRTKKIRRIKIVFDENFEKEIFDNLAAQAVTVRKTFLTNKYKKNDLNLKESIIYMSLPKSRSYEDVLNQISSQEYVFEVEDA